MAVEWSYGDADGSWYALGDAPTAGSVDDLTLTRERVKQPINEFLERRHPLGGVTGWKACFGARYQDYIVAVLVLGRPVARAADDGTELNITRFCRRDDRPANTGSWLIAKGRTWAELEGYDTVSAHAGVAGNYGTVYEAAGFDLDCPHCSWQGHRHDLLGYVPDEWVGVCPECENPPLVDADGKGWLTQGDDRNTWEDYERRKWVYELGQQQIPVSMSSDGGSE